MKKIYNMTYFQCKTDKTGKIPFSYSDGVKHFEFKNKQFNNLKDALELMARNFTLSIPLKEEVKTTRTSAELSKYQFETLTHLVLDLDDIKSLESVIKIKKILKENRFRCILSKSRSYNGIDKFNLKGLIDISIYNTKNNIKKVLDFLSKKLEGLCKVDHHINSESSFQAPMLRFDIVLENLKHKNKTLNEKFFIEEGIELDNKEKIEIEKLKKYKNIKELNLDSIESFESLKTFDNIKIDDSIMSADTTIKKIKSKKNKHDNLSFTDILKNIFNIFEFELIKFDPIKKLINLQNAQEKTKGGYFWYMNNPFVIQHFNPEKNINIFRYFKESDAGKSFIWQYNLINEAKELSDNAYKGYKCNERYLILDDKKKEIIDNFFNNKKSILEIKSPMGSGKSNILKYSIERAKKENKKIMMISNRITIAKDFSKKYDMPLYSELPENTDNIIVQFDSLHKFDVKKYDLVIFDEFVSILLHHRSNLNINNLNFMNFKYLLDNKNIIISDAFMCNYINKFFDTDLDSDLNSKRKRFIINNEYRDKVQLNDYCDKNTFFHNLIKDAEAVKNTDESITLSVTSNKILKYAEKRLRGKGLKVVVLNSDCKNSLKDMILEKISLKEKFCDVLIYSPTLTVGVSNLNNVKKHYHFDSGKSCDVISSLQMIKRSRNAEIINYYIECDIKHNTTSLNVLNDNIIKNLKDYSKKDSLICVEYSNGDFRISEVGLHLSKIEIFNNLLSNNKINSFKKLCELQFTQSSLNETIIDESNETYENVDKESKKLKNTERDNFIKEMNEVAEEIDLSELNLSNFIDVSLSNRDKIAFKMFETQNKLSSYINNKKLAEIASYDMIDNSIYNKTKFNIFFNQSLEYIKERYKDFINNDVRSLRNDKNNFMMKYSLIFKKYGTVLKDSYTLKEIKEYNAKFLKETKNGIEKNIFLDFIKELGYKKIKETKEYCLCGMVSDLKVIGIKETI